TLPPRDQRQSRGDGQDPDQLVGVRRALSEHCRTGRRPCDVHGHLQSSPSTRRLERRPTDRPGPSMMPVETPPSPTRVLPGRARPCLVGTTTCSGGGRQTCTTSQGSDRTGDRNHLPPLRGGVPPSSPTPPSP